MKSEEFHGKASEIRNSPWLASEDIIAAGKNPIGTIEAVNRNEDVEFEAGRKEKLKFSLRFKGWDRQLIVNGSIRKALIDLYGHDVDGWTGKRVKLYVDHNVRGMGGKIVCGIRVCGPDEEPPKSAAEKVREKL